MKLRVTCGEADFWAGLNEHIEENNRMRNTRDFFKKIRDTKGNFHAKMGSIKDRNGMDLTEAEDIKKRWQEYTESESESEVLSRVQFLDTYLYRKVKRSQERVFAHKR